MAALSCLSTCVLLSPLVEPPASAPRTQFATRRSPTLRGVSGEISRRGLLGGFIRAAVPQPEIDYDGVTERIRAGWDACSPNAPMMRALEPVAEVLAEAAGAAPGQRILDVGAGTGNVALACSERGAAVDACDLSPRMVMAGLERTGPTVRWSQGDAAMLPYDDAAFDAVVSAFGAAMAPRARRTAGELARVLRPGGRPPRGNAPRAPPAPPDPRAGRAAGRSRGAAPRAGCPTASAAA